MNSKQIIQGSINNILNAQEDLYLKRIKICRQCKLYILKPFLGGMCNNKLFYNKELDDIKKIQKRLWVYFKFKM